MSNNKQTRFSLRKGLSSDLPTHAPLGEPLFCTDTGELYVGMGSGSKPKPVTNKELSDKLTTVSSQLDNMAIDVSTQDDLIKAINKVSNGGSIILNNNIDISTQIIIDKNITFDGRGYKLTCISNGLHDWFKITSEIGNVKNTIFDDNNKGRVILTCLETRKLIISNCEFTGYSKEYGYYRTDGLVRLDGNFVDVIIEKCNFYDSGYNVGIETEELNRCISFNSTTGVNGTVRDCTFKNVNQAIVSVIKNLNIENCVFENVKDNSVYTSGEMLKVNNCTFINGEDEPIITSCKINKITNNTFNDFNNKAIGMSGSEMLSLDVTNNTFINSKGRGQVLSYRDGAYCKKINFTNNTCDLTENIYNNTFAVIITGNSDLFNVSDTYILTNQPNNSYVIRSNAKKITLNNNYINNISGASGCITLKSDYAGAVKTVKDNDVYGSRLIADSLSIGSNVEVNAKYLTNNRNNILFAVAKPNYILPKGTIVYNTSYTKITDVILWISNGTEWIEERSIRPIIHKSTNTPVNWTTPRFKGDLWIGNSGSVWVGVGEDQTSASWKKLVD